VPPVQAAIRHDAGMLEIALTTVPFFGLVLCGWVAAHTRRLPAQSVAPLNGFVLWFALPAMLFRFVAAVPVEDILDARIALGYAATGLLVYAATASFLRRRLACGWVDTGFGALAGAWPNWGYMGFGLMPALFGESAISIMIAAGMMDLLVLMPVALVVASRGHSAQGLAALASGFRGVARNPLFLAIVAGFAVSLLRVRVPAPLDEFLRLLGSSAGPVALFAIGVFVHRPGPIRADAGSWVLVAAKLVLHPLLAWVVAATVLGLPPATAAVLTVVAALPAAGTAFLFVERNGGNVDRVASAILLSTALSFVTITLLAAWLRAPGS
jgi:predicted permease